MTRVSRETEFYFGVLWQQARDTIGSLSWGPVFLAFQPWLQPAHVHLNTNRVEMETQSLVYNLPLSRAVPSLDYGNNNCLLCLFIRSMSFTSATTRAPVIQPCAEPTLDYDLAAPPGSTKTT